MRRFASLILVCALVASCFGRKPVPPSPAAPALKDFPMVTVPGVITDPSERAAWLAEHFWEAFEKASDLDSASFEQAVGTLHIYKTTAYYETHQRTVGQDP